MAEASTNLPSKDTQATEILYYCEKHGIMNKSTDLKEKADQIANKA
jgi:hypothetical protein